MSMMDIEIIKKSTTLNTQLNIVIPIWNVIISNKIGN